MLREISKQIIQIIRIEGYNPMYVTATTAMYWATTHMCRQEAATSVSSYNP